MPGRGVKLLFVEQDIVSAEDHVLHHDVLVATDFFTAEVWTLGGLVTYYLKVARKWL